MRNGHAPPPTTKRTSNENDTARRTRTTDSLAGARHQQLLAMLPAGVNDFADLAAAEFDAKLADIELVTAEMMVINAAERAILEELESRP